MSSPTKSLLFSQFDVSDEQNTRFVRDLREVMSLDENQRSILISHFAPYIEAIDSAVKEQLIHETSLAAHLTEITVRSGYQLITFLLRQLDDEGIAQDSAADWAYDLEALGVIEHKDSVAFTSFASAVKDRLALQLHTKARERSAERGVLPLLSGVGVSVELRGVVKRGYRWGDAVEAYDPQIEALVPVVSVLLSLDSGFPGEMGFQVSMGLLDRLIASLTAAKKTATQLAARTNLGPRISSPASGQVV